MLLQKRRHLARAEDDRHFRALSAIDRLALERAREVDDDTIASDTERSASDPNTQYTGSPDVGMFVPVTVTIVPPRTDPNAGDTDAM